jgi:segregation and condensation protein B
MEPRDLAAILEAMLFAADRPLTVAQLVRGVDDDDVSATEVKDALEHLMERSAEPDRGVQLMRFGSGYQLLTREAYAPFVDRIAANRRASRLSRAALETAAVIGYKQPITRHEIERIRGVDVGAVLQTLLERNLIMIKGRDTGPGRPLLYGTTQEFLEYFGLSKITDLPQLDEIAALAREKGSAVWTDDERSRFERHGVEPDTVPPPREEGGEPPEGEAPAESDAYASAWAGDEPAPAEDAPPLVDDEVPDEAPSPPAP